MSTKARGLLMRFRPTGSTRHTIFHRVAIVLAIAFTSTFSQARAHEMNQSTWWDGYDKQVQYVTLVDGRKMLLYCMGSGSPTVILDAGWGGGGVRDWRLVQVPIARVTRVCSYDRAGLGRSDPAPSPRDTKAIVADLQELLRVANVRGPYVMVGHSMGGFDVRLFADRNLSQVTGMVLVDPAGDNQFNRFDAISPKLRLAQNRSFEAIRNCLKLAQVGVLKVGTPEFSNCGGNPPTGMPQHLVAEHARRALSPFYYQAQLDEADGLMSIDSAEAVAERRSLGAIPLIVLTASNTTKLPGLSPLEEAAVSELWSQMHDELAALSSNGVNRHVSGSGHYIQLDAPQAVIDAVDEVVHKSRLIISKQNLGMARKP